MYGDFEKHCHYAIVIHVCAFCMSKKQSAWHYHVVTCDLMCCFMLYCVSSRSRMCENNNLVVQAFATDVIMKWKIKELINCANHDQCQYLVKLPLIFFVVRNLHFTKLNSRQANVLQHANETCLVELKIICLRCGIDQLMHSMQWQCVVENRLYKYNSHNEMYWFVFRIERKARTNCRDCDPVFGLFGKSFDGWRDHLLVCLSDSITTLDWEILQTTETCIAVDCNCVHHHHRQHQCVVR